MKDSIAQRHNKMMDRVFDNYEKNHKDPAIKSFKKHQVKIGKAYSDKGDQYPGPKAAALAKKTATKDNYPLNRKATDPLSRAIIKAHDAYTQ